MSFYDQVFEASRQRTSPQDVFSYYKKEYTGSKTLKNGKTIYNWQSKLADDLHQVLGIERASVMRRFQGKRGEALREGKVSKGHEDEYELLGGMLPRMTPENGYHIHGTVWVTISEECVQRFPDEIITGEDADALTAMASEEVVQGFINYYMTGDVDMNKYEQCGKPDLTVEALD